MLEATTSASLTVDGGVARLTLNRPERLNAIDAAMHEALRRSLDQIEADAGIGALMLTGAGKAFCAGQDLAERRTQFETDGEVDLAASLADNYNPLARRLAALPFPVIAAVNGVAAGAGAALALACDIVLAARSARFQFAFARVALGPDSGTSHILPRLVGSARALGLALTGDAIAADEAERIGLIWRVVDDDRLAAEAGRLVAGFANGPRPALTAIKAQLRAALGRDFDQCLDAERTAQGLLGRHPHYRAAVMAFAEKRTPSFNNETEPRMAT